MVAALAMAGSVFAPPAIASAATATVSNNISVSASGGESNTSVRTIINGETVEDISISSQDPITYTSIVTSTTSTTTATSSAAEIEQLRALISQLQILLTLYEKLFLR